jgi:hypothetical protein
LVAVVQKECHEQGYPPEKDTQYKPGDETVTFTLGYGGW